LPSQENHLQKRKKKLFSFSNFFWLLKFKKF